MGLLEILGAIFTFIVNLFVQYNVTFGTPIATNNAKVVKNGKNYTVNKNTEVVFELNFKKYKSYKISYNNASNDNYKSESKCKAVTGNDKTSNISVSSSDNYGRKVKIVAYKESDCTGSSTEYVSPVVSYKAPSNETTKIVAKNGVNYLMVKDKSNGNWKKIGTQGHYTSTCNCYAKAYAMAMIDGTILNPNKYGTDHNGAVKCWDQNFAGDNYVSNDRHFVSSTTKVFEIARDAIVNDGLPTMVLVGNSSGNTHYLLVTGVKEGSVGKLDSQLSYSDFWVVDPVGSQSQPSTSENPKERNWQTLIDNANGNSSNRKLKKGSNSEYEITEKNK